MIALSAILREPGSPGNSRQNTSDAMNLFEPPIILAGMNSSIPGNNSEVDINNNITFCSSNRRPKSMTGTAVGTGPEFNDGDRPIGFPPSWNASSDDLGNGAGVTTASESPLVDGEIGQVFLSANRALYGCDEHDAAEPNASRSTPTDVDVDDEDDDRLFIALEPEAPDGRRVMELADVDQSTVGEKTAESSSGTGQELPGSEATETTVPRPGGRRRVREQDKPLACGKCGRRFILKKMLENHKCGIMHTCAECGKPFKKRCQLQAHAFIHKQAKDFVCDICQRAFKEKSNFNRHVRTHSSLRPYKCPHCVKCFKVAATLYVHRLTHDARGRFVCDFCGKDFKRPEHLRQHRRIHTGEKPYRCSVCQQCFTTDNTLRTHMRRHTGERPYPCPICQKRFTQSSAMKTHWKRHSESREFDCSVCHLKFKQKYDLNRHMICHNTERPHQCSSCHLRFKTRSSLQKHRETHSQERQFSCATCGKTFRRLAYLRLHETTHGANTRFACTLCTKSFTRRYNLRLHQEEHQEGGRRRHFCATCRRCFRRASGLRQHVKTAHGELVPGVEQGEPLADAQREEKPAVGEQGEQDQGETSQKVGGLTSAVDEESAVTAPCLEMGPEIMTLRGGWMEQKVDSVDDGENVMQYSAEAHRPAGDEGQRYEVELQEYQVEVKKEEESSEEELIVD